MNKYLVRFLAVILGLFIAERILVGIQIDGLLDAAIFALCLGVVNLLVRPVLLVLTFPITILTLGLFIFVVNAVLFLLVDVVIRGIHIDGFITALFGSLIVSTVSWFVQKIT